MPTTPTPQASSGYSASSPVAVADVYTLTAGGTLVVDADHGLLANDTDPNGRPLSIYPVTFISSQFPGELKVERDGAFTLHSLPTSLESLTFGYVVVNDRGLSSRGTVTIHLTNSAPVAEPDVYRLHGSQFLNLGPEAGPLANDHDAEGHALRLLAIRSLDGDGEIMPTPGGGFRFVAAPGYTGTADFRYLVSDSFGARSEGTLSIEVWNTRPEARADEVWIHPGKPVTFRPADLLANDFDADGDTLHFSTTNLAGLEGKGRVVQGSDGSLSFEPDKHFDGLAKFSYAIHDGHGGWASASVWIHVGNQAPAVIDDVYRVVSGERLVVRGAGVLANDHDPEGDRMHVTQIDTAGLHGRLELRDDGGLGFTPEPGFVGKTSASFLVEDGWGVATPSSVTFEVLPPALQETAIDLVGVEALPMP